MGSLERSLTHLAQDADGPSVHVQRSETATPATAWMGPKDFMHKASHKRTNTVQLHGEEILLVAKFIEIES